ncbi:MAG: hypothetical protein LUH22_11015 [Bacteroides sp.]|nr:hypothetical protein [Bacteroides sp.]
MKNIFFSLMLVFSMNCFSQVVSEFFDEKGVRNVNCEKLRLYERKDSVYLSMGFLGKEYSGKTNYYIKMQFDTDSTELTIKKGSILLLRNNNEEIIELKSDSDYESGERIVVGTIANSGNKSSARIYHTAIAFYPITPEQLLKVTSGIIKLRVEYNSEALDKEFKKDVIGVYVKKNYDLIQRRLLTKINKELSDF